MVDDDDPINEQAPAGRPAEETTKEAPAEQPPEGEQAETETQAEFDLGEEADDEQDDDEQDDDESEGESDEPKPKRRTGSERYKRQAERLKAENAALRSRSDGGVVPSDQAQMQRAFEYAVWQEIGDPPNENDPQYKDNYVALERDRQAYALDRRMAIRDVRKNFLRATQQAQQDTANLVREHKERVARFKTKVKDYDEVMAKATTPVAPHVERLLLQSKKSERLSYALGKNEAKLVQLNNMQPEQAAREIGRLEGRLSLPTQTRTQTKARKPITPLKGGGSSPPSGLSAVNAYIKKLYGDRA